MYNFIVNLFTEEDYNSLLEEDTKLKAIGIKIFIVPPNPEITPFIIEKENIGEQIDDNPILKDYPKTDLVKYFNLNRFVNPTHNNSNDIGSVSALLSHSPTHIKITNAFIDEKLQHPNGHSVIKFPIKKLLRKKTTIDAIF